MARQKITLSLIENNKCIFFSARSGASQRLICQIRRAFHGQPTSDPDRREGNILVVGVLTDDGKEEKGGREEEENRQ